LVTSFGLNRPSLGQYFPKLKNDVAYSIIRQYAPAFLIFCKYCPDDGLFRPKLVANNRKNKLKIVVSDGVHILTERDVLYQAYPSRAVTEHFAQAQYRPAFLKE
jgi:hypothetical protein